MLFSSIGLVGPTWELPVVPASGRNLEYFSNRCGDVVSLYLDNAAGLRSRLRQPYANLGQ